MSNFHKIKFPDFLALQAVGSPLLATSVASTASGREARQSDRMHAAQQYNISSCRLSAEQFEVFNAFFRARMGMRFSFLMRDYADCKLVNQPLAPSEIDSNSFQAIKTYGDFINPYKRKITKLVEGSVRLIVGDLDLRAARIEHDKGVVTLEEPLLPGQRLIIDADFDIEVRFSSDDFKYYMDPGGSVVIDELLLIEVL